MIRDHIEDYGGRLYEKCQHCHLFVEVNAAYSPLDVPVVAQFVHSSRGDTADERLEDHEAEPSGLLATLPTWMVYGPSAMRERFVTIPKEG